MSRSAKFVSREIRCDDRDVLSCSCWLQAQQPPAISPDVYGQLKYVYRAGRNVRRLLRGCRGAEHLVCGRGFGWNLKTRMGNSLGRDI